ncbi:MULTISPECIES: chorismate lyase [unclassified Nitrosomonas]|jgi:chorismate--pyruvate lyase|uniref:chorismate--pyruvate lyase family protein n=1 Tax=unclassified Nitrosomonas TaxID=2609265 RepID=UPI00089009FD|nr:MULTISPECIES: chorismate lyase [unclassified Nitrosomonas]SDH54491.1 chorismate--pyruvate lyase [Nitrosomonas sp. Nm132]SDY59452.1 chorismate--pyruvate lyase [Nitrosomonas sp. Nm58]
MSADQPLAWYPVPVTASINIRWWLLHRDSLTRLIQQRCSKFSVDPLFQSLAPACTDELVMMNLRRGELALVREVYLYCGDIPVVFAHSVVARKHLQSAWRGLSRLGNRSLGTMLFTNPMIKRAEFGYKQLNIHHPLFKRACQRLQTPPTSLWARRSLFTLQGQPILVTEVFLPAILRLKI